MTQRKILIPEAMRLAAGRATHLIDPEGYIVYPALEAAIRWLDQELDQLRKKREPGIFYRSESQADSYQNNGFNLAISAVRSIFAPEANPAVERVKKTVCGCTLTREEADEIMEYVNRCAPPREED